MISNELRTNGPRRVEGFVGTATMKLSLVTLTLLCSVHGDIRPNQEIANVPSSTSVPIADVRANSPLILSTSILPPRRDFVASTNIFNKNEKVEPIFLDTIESTRSPPLTVILPESRSSELESSRGFVRIPGATDRNANIATIERNDEIASDDTSMKLFLSGSLRDELIVSRPGSDAVFIKGASRVTVIDDAQNSVIVCPPNTNLSPPPFPEETTRTHGIDFDRKLSTLPPTVLISESPKIPPSNDPPTELKDYLVPPYSYWQR